MSLRKAFIATLFALGSFATPQAGEKILVVADEWPPFGGESLHNGGISLDVISTILTRAGYDVSTQIVPWERALEGAKTGTYDVVGNLFKDPRLLEYMSYSDPFFATEVRFVRRIGTDHAFTNLNSLKPLSIAVGAGYLYEEEFDNAEFLKKTEVTTVIQGVRMVANNRVDLTLDSVDVINYIIHKEDPTLGTQVELMPNSLADQAIHFAVRNDLPSKEKLIKDFNRILAEMDADGSLDALLAKHRY